MKISSLDYDKEWLISNGIGGYASSTVVLNNTRRYHGLLIAPLNPPARRQVIVSKLDESICIEDKKYDLFNQQVENMFVDNTLNLKSFDFSFFPKFGYMVEKISVTKEIFMPKGKNEVVIKYSIKNSGNTDAKMHISPVINFRDIHHIIRENELDLLQDIDEEGVVAYKINNNKEYNLEFEFSEGRYIKKEKDIYKNMMYVQEKERGFDYLEDHIVPGTIEIDILKKTTRDLFLRFSLVKAKDSINKYKKNSTGNVGNLNKEYNHFVKCEQARYDKILKSVINGENKEKIDLIKKLVIASDNFIIKRAKRDKEYISMIAGYPWFLDWGRDSLISSVGILLATKRYDELKSLLEFLVLDMKHGIIPNGYSEEDNTPYYNAVDVSLLYIEILEKYVAKTKDWDFLNNMYPKVIEIIEAYISKDGNDFAGNNIRFEDDYLLSTGSSKIQNTWMDAKIGDYVVTPRNGKAVEINALLYNVINIAVNRKKNLNDLNIRKYRENIDKYKKIAVKMKKSFLKKFKKENGGLRDVLIEDGMDEKIRPNQLFALCLSYQIVDLDSKDAYDIVCEVEKELKSPLGLMTLNRGDHEFAPIYEGDPVSRDSSYHQGITWSWLNQIYYLSLKNIVNKYERKRKKETDPLKIKIYKEISEKEKEFKKEIYGTYKKEIVKLPSFNGIPELNDSCEPYRGKGAPFQAWSTSAILKILIG